MTTNHDILATLPAIFWIADGHWVREAEAEGRGYWRLARKEDWALLTDEQAAAVRAELAYWGEQGANPQLWREVDTAEEATHYLPHEEVRELLDPDFV